MRLVPVYLRFGYRAIREPNEGEALQLSPVTGTEELRQNAEIADPVT